MHWVAFARFTMNQPIPIILPNPANTNHTPPARHPRRTSREAIASAANPVMMTSLRALV
jgi:hypothetical protein